ncbi:hypothetical protein GGX14DRAFT_675005 [Mycena pura]|uniref:Uncharacterized protein n=1 Tax=Mycena pura TaxID=153505 RepID=A0AAD6VRC1_9AGAR|nr:hypothetical protein GGX14DRAFT_675005 [Mycena pura]
MIETYEVTCTPAAAHKRRRHSVIPHQHRVHREPWADVGAAAARTGRDAHVHRKAYTVSAAPTAPVYSDMTSERILTGALVNVYSSPRNWLWDRTGDTAEAKDNRLSDGASVGHCTHRLGTHTAAAVHRPQGGKGQWRPREEQGGREIEGKDKSDFDPLALGSRCDLRTRSRPSPPGVINPPAVAPSRRTVAHPACRFPAFRSSPVGVPGLDGTQKYLSPTLRPRTFCTCPLHASLDATYRYTE